MSVSRVAGPVFDDDQNLKYTYYKYTYYEKNSVVADWNNENNVLTGTSDDCSEISLQLMVFPGYNGLPTQQIGMDSTHWQNIWTDQSYGNGDFELGMEVNVNQPPGQFAPTIQDNDEEVFVTWKSVFFTVAVE